MKPLAIIVAGCAALAACAPTADLVGGDRTYYYPAEQGMDEVRSDIDALGMCGDKQAVNFSQPVEKGGRAKITFDCR